MPNSTEPREAEPVAVTLVRIETGVGNILEKVIDLRAEVVVHRGQIGKIESNVQQLQSDQRAAEKAVKDADKAREDTAAALEKQNALALAKAKDAVDSATRAWAPRNFAIALGSLIIAAIAVYAAFKYGATTSPTL
jgi:hypothetical protein